MCLARSRNREELAGVNTPTSMTCVIDTLLQLVSPASINTCIQSIILSFIPLCQSQRKVAGTTIHQIFIRSPRCVGGPSCTWLPPISSNAERTDTRLPGPYFLKSAWLGIVSCGLFDLAAFFELWSFSDCFAVVYKSSFMFSWSHSLRTFCL